MRRREGHPGRRAVVYIDRRRHSSCATGRHQPPLPGSSTRLFTVLATLARHETDFSLFEHLTSRPLSVFGPVFLYSLPNSCNHVRPLQARAE